MTKFVFSYAGAPLDYPTLGFTADADGAILDGSLFDPDLTIPPDARWSVYGGGDPETDITRYATPSVDYLNPVPEVTDGWLLAYSTDANTGTYQDPADLIETGAWATPLSAAYGGQIMPEQFGAAATYSSGTDDTTYVQAALDAAATTGGEVYLRRVYNVPSGGLTHTGRVTIRGCGGMLSGDPVHSFSPTARSGIRVNHATATALTLTDARGSLLKDFAVVNDRTTAPTAGTGIKFVGDGSTSQCNIEGVTIVAFYDLMETSGVFFTVNHCRFYDAVRYGLYLNNTGTNYYDHGDLGIHNNVFAQNYKNWDATAGIRWRSGGGVRITGNKFLGGVGVGLAPGGHFAVPIDVQSKDGVATGDLTITGNSISNFTTCGVRITVENSGGTAGSFINAVIVGNLINVGYGSACAAIFGAPTTGLVNNIRGIVFSDNEIDNLPGGGIKAHNLIGLFIGTNTWSTITGGPLITLADLAGSEPTTKGVRVAPQNIGAGSSARAMTGIDVVTDNRTQSNAGANDGKIHYEYGADLFLNTVSTWVTLFTITVKNGGGGKIEFDFSGTDFASPSTGISGHYERLWHKTQNSNNTTLSTIGTDATAGTNVPAVQFDTSASSASVGVIKVQMMLNVGRTTAWGECSVKVDGRVATFRVGA